MNTTDDLFLASTIGDLIWLKSCIEQDGLDPLVLRNKHGYTCLHLSALSARPNCVEYLLGRGLSPGDLTEETNSNTFHLAVERKNGSRGVITLKLLLQSLYHIPTNTYLDQQNKAGRTPLHIAISLGCIAYIKLLLKANAQTDIRDVDANLPIDVAKIEGRYEAMRLLQAHQWSLDKNKKQHFMLVSMNRELLESQNKSRSDLEERKRQSNDAYVTWSERKNLPMIENKLYPDSGPKDKVSSPVVTLRINKDISLNLEQKKHNLTLYKHTQPLPAPLSIRATSAMKRYKVWLPDVVTKSAPSTRHEKRDSLALASSYASRPSTQARVSVTVPLNSNRDRQKVCNNSSDEKNASSQNKPCIEKTADRLRKSENTKLDISNKRERELISKLPIKVPIRIQNFIFPDNQFDLL